MEVRVERSKCRVVFALHGGEWTDSLGATMKLWKNGAWLKSKIPESVSDETRGAAVWEVGCGNAIVQRLDRVPI